MDRARFAEVLRRLAGNDVEFIVVGLMAGVLRGAPVMTADLDIVHKRSAENVSRLLKVLAELDAVLATTHGDVDCLGEVGGGRGYEELLGRAPRLEIGQGLAVHVIDLPTLIELKELAARPKDLAALPVLRATHAETLRRS